MLDINEVINILKKPSKEDAELITRAFEFAQEAHDGQKRCSGEPYIVHPFETAKILASLQLDAKTIAAGLLHDVEEDCLITGIKSETTTKSIRKNFGDEILFLVSGVTKLGGLKLKGNELTAENFRRMFLAMAKDIRVILIKLSDRLHNIKTLEYVPEEKRKRIAVETLEIYVPISNRLGIGEIKGKLEDLSFPHVYPEEYKNLMKMLKGKYEKKENELAKVKYALRQELGKNGMKNIDVSSRVKNLYSLYQKLQRPKYNMDIDKIYDLIAIRIIVPSVEDCYKVLGIIHNLWRPIPGTIKDYIAMPKLNGYQSLHTTVFATDGKMTEIQIRTQQMHEEAEHGIAAHWAYTESGKPEHGSYVNPRLAWVNQLAEWQKGTPGSKDFLESLRIDFFKDRVFCFTPKGDVIDLPEGASAIDFAYAIHGDIGNRATGALINGKFVSLDSVLKNADIVEIKTQKNKKPSMQWLSHTKTSLAKKQIRSALNKNQTK